ncbi:MAG: SPFH domain-containing protein, partial [Lachnospiraceae bacterium]|nr:SPFH domain-containing protein [Lachnospiraceae bacterium]
MKEKILTEKKNGMLVLLSVILVYIVAIIGLIIGTNVSAALTVISIIVLCLAWFPLCGLKVLKPQEALVLTLFGNYIGSIKGEGFYFVNPFC